MRLRAFALVFLLAFVAMMRLAAAQVLSPGPLSQAHANIDGDDNCGKCHESGAKVVAKLCLDCHKDLRDQLSASRGLHGKQYRGQDCETCHVEHIGKNTKLIRWPGGAPEKLDHALTGWSLDGGHAKVTPCSKCHTKTSPLGKTQFVGTKTTCAGCHKDPHAGKFTTTCQKCHSVTEWKTFDKKAFDHALAAYPLTGKHQAVACEKCHTGTPPKWKPLVFATCESCHEDVHKGAFKPKACTTCHDTGGWESGADKMRTNHPKLSLAAGHARLDCKACHDRGNDKSPSKGSTCASCHKPIHVAKFGAKCESCHASIKWVGLAESVGRDNHGKTRYPLEEKHQTVACARCHLASKPVAQRYRSLAFGACMPCHADQHQGEFAAKNQGDCAQCHTLKGFLPTTFGVAQHAATAFAIEGKHRATPCSGCHTNPRPRTSLAVGKRACADCHQNPHGTQFAAEMNKGGCASCHSAADWHQPKIDHSTWPLAGAHARTACAACHGEQKSGAQPAAYRGIPRACEGCHDDVHAGQFTAAAPKKACTGCHDTDSFQIATKFPHASTSFALDGEHTKVACKKCHPTESLRNGTTAVRWRLGYQKCKDCHANPHGDAP